MANKLDKVEVLTLISLAAGKVHLNPDVNLMHALDLQLLALLLSGSEGYASHGPGPLTAARYPGH